MTKRSTAVLLAFALLLSIMLLAGIAAAEEKDKDILGKPFPDFTVKDTEGNTFTLSEALKDHEAVLINSWATWCGPCRNEFPDLNKAYEKYHDKVAFIALSMGQRTRLKRSRNTGRKTAFPSRWGGMRTIRCMGFITR